MADLLQLPPQALEAEMAVLGSMMIHAEAVDRAVELLDEADFYKETHRRVFHAAAEIHRANQAVDVITVGDHLRSQKLLGEVGGPQFLQELVNKVSTAAHVEHYANIVREKSVLRELIKVSTEVVGQAYREEKPSSQLLDEAQGRIMQVAQRSTVTGFVAAKDLAHDVISDIEALAQRKGEVTGVGTGLKKFDRMTAGFQKGDLILIAARPSQGKTALALNIAAHVVLNNKVATATAFFSLEMSRNAIMTRLIASEARVNLHEARNGFFRRDRWTDLTNAAARISESPLFIDDSAGLSILDVRSRARRLQLELQSRGQALGLIMIDYLQLMRGPNRRVENRQQEVSEISRGLKHLARDMNIPVVALSQLNRRSEDKGRTDNKPQMSDLRDSGSLEQDADVIALIHREGYYNRSDPTVERNAELIIAKQRNGPVGTCELTFISELARFENKELGGAESEEAEDTQVSFS
ncbi:MAG: replicative DNA helicase [Elusimicrobia bacterium]|nr:replicative DNA helicase [Elusimicrobiota bacterium]